MSMKIYLNGKNKDKYALVDDEDYEWVNKYKWYLNTNGYAIAVKWESGKSKTIFMHKEILKTKPNMMTDHINRDRLDNRKENLRELTRSENAINTSFLGHSNSKSGHVGVYWHKSVGMWEAVITYNKKKYHLGHYEDIEDAIDAYITKRKELYGNITEDY